MRILVVDDNLLIRRLLRAILTDGGHEVVGEAEDGGEALHRYQALRPEVVTLDLVMPGEHGLAVLFDLKRIDPRAVVLVCSAHLTERRVLSAIELGAAGFISKPFDRARVLDAVQAAVAGSGATAPRPAELAPDVDGSDRREFERVPAVLPVVLLPAGRAPVRTVTTDISGSGMAVADALLSVGQRVRFSLRLDPGGQRVMGWARVVRTVPGEGQALTIEDLPVVDHERMISYIRHRHTAPGSR